MKEIVTQTIDGLIEGNLETISNDIKEWLSEYDNYVVSVENCKDAKNLLATARKEQKAYDDERKDGKNAYMAKWNEFEGKLKPIIALYDDLINRLDKDIKEVENNQKQAKLERVKAIYEELIGDMREYAPFEFIFDKKYGNASTSEKSIKEDIQQKIDGIRMAVDTIKMNDSFVDGGLEEYKRTHNLPLAMQKMKEYSNVRKALVEEQKKASNEKPVKEPEKENEIVFIIKAKDVFDADTIEFKLNEAEIEYERRG